MTKLPTLLSDDNDIDDVERDNDDDTNDNNDKDAHPLVGFLKGENEGVHVSQVIFEEIHELVDICLLKLTIIIYHSIKVVLIVHPNNQRYYSITIRYSLKWLYYCR